MENIYALSVRDAVNKSVSTSLPMMVVISDGSDQCEAWITSLISSAINLVKTHFVALKITKPSEEYNFFSQIFPSPPPYTIYFVKTGKLLSIVTREITPDQFASRVAGLVKQSVTPENKSKGKPQSESKSKSSPPTAKAYSSIKEQIAEESAARYRQELIRKRKAEKEERERILRLVQQDRELRRREKEMAAAPPKPTPHSPPVSGLKKNYAKCTIQVRLLDGQKLMHDFSPEDPLLKVREWIDQSRNGDDEPYAFFEAVFKKTYDVTDERLLLRELGLVPRSTLVLKPEKSYTHAYQSRSWFNTIGNTLYSILGYKNQEDGETRSENVSSEDVNSFYSSSSHVNGSITSLTDLGRDEKDKKVVYNGNHTSLEDDLNDKKLMKDE